jgi:hypothetical protein
LTPVGIVGGLCGPGALPGGAVLPFPAPLAGVPGKPPGPVAPEAGADEIVSVPVGEEPVPPAPDDTAAPEPPGLAGVDAGLRGAGAGGTDGDVVSRWGGAWAAIDVSPEGPIDSATAAPRCLSITRSGSTAVTTASPTRSPGPTIKEFPFVSTIATRTRPPMMPATLIPLPGGGDVTAAGGPEGNDSAAGGGGSDAPAPESGTTSGANGSGLPVVGAASPCRASSGLAVRGAGGRGAVTCPALRALGSIPWEPGVWAGADVTPAGGAGGSTVFPGTPRWYPKYTAPTISTLSATSPEGVRDFSLCVGLEGAKLGKERADFRGTNPVHRLSLRRMCVQWRCG